MDYSRLEQGECQTCKSSSLRHDNFHSESIIQVCSEADDCLSSDKREEDVGDSPNIPRSTIERFFQGVLRVVKDIHLQHVLQDHGERSEKPAVAGSTEPRLHHLGTSDASKQTFPRPCVTSENGDFVHESGKRCCGFLSTCDDSPRDTIKAAPPSGIRAENAARKFYRKEWRVDSIPEHLLDPWKHLWRPQGGVATGLSEWACEDVERQNLQLNLIDALAAGSPIPFVHEIMRTEFRNITCWISLVGIRLNAFYRSLKLKEVTNGNTLIRNPNIISPMTQVEVLIECLWACNGCANAEVGRVLSNCYERSVLAQPSFDGTRDIKETTQTLSSHVCVIKIGIYLISLLFKHEVPEYKSHEDLDRVWNMPMHEVEKHMRQKPRMSNNQSGSQTGNAYFFSIDDLNLKDLQRLGHLRISWTSCWDEHLQLEIRENSQVLYLYWFNHDLSRYFAATGLCGGLTDSERMDRKEQIERTMSFILCRDAELRVRRQLYESLGAPEWLELLAGFQLQAWTVQPEAQKPPSFTRPLSEFRLDPDDGSSEYCKETKLHLSVGRAEGDEYTSTKLSYSSFPHYEHRIRELRAYMDSQQPKGLRALWRDRRNSYTFYTFWLVILIGIVTVVLAVGSLATSIAQTING
ncbi:MAG: hypothetical protein LQ348_004347 [Seirophora lacunosa]|nr:MAG: hypothetical protein LQ348_004347 [Seirophora lacunosa]